MNPLRLFREWKNRREVRWADESEYVAFGTIDGIPMEADAATPRPGVRPPWVAADLYRVTPTETTEEEELDRLDQGLNPVLPGKVERIPPFPDAWRCRTCRWWGKTTFSPAYEGWGSCKREFDSGNKISSPDPNNPEGIETAPDFGCTQWQAKED